MVEAAIPLAFTAAWASGINPYLLVFLMGILGRVTDFNVPIAFERVDVLLVFGVLVVIDAIADKIMWLDSAWDVFNTAIRPIAGGVVAMLIASPSVDLPSALIAAGGGVVALITHFAKATTRLGGGGRRDRRGCHHGDIQSMDRGRDRSDTFHGRCCRGDRGSGNSKGSPAQTKTA